jgi:GxxExxY protein
MTENELAKIIVDRGFKIHTTLGPGLLESVYEELLAYELQKADLNFARQKGVPVAYEGVKMDLGLI